MIRLLLTPRRAIFGATHRCGILSNDALSASLKIRIDFKSLFGILIGIKLKVYTGLGCINILTTVILPVHEHGISLICAFFRFFH